MEGRLTNYSKLVCSIWINWWRCLKPKSSWRITISNLIVILCVILKKQHKPDTSYWKALMSKITILFTLMSKIGRHSYYLRLAYRYPDWFKMIFCLFQLQNLGYRCHRKIGNSIQSYLKTIDKTLMNISRFIVVKCIVMYCPFCSILIFSFWQAISNFVRPWFISCYPWNNHSLPIIVTLCDVYLKTRSVVRISESHLMEKNKRTENPLD